LAFIDIKTREEKIRKKGGKREKEVLANEGGKGKLKLKLVHLYCAVMGRRECMKNID
jgi:hypothetical protein